MPGTVLALKIRFRGKEDPALQELLESCEQIHCIKYMIKVHTG